MAIANYGKWKPKKGTFEVFNKEFGKKMNHNPDEFILLDELCVINGFDTKNNCPIYSNKIKRLKDEEFSVRTKNGEIYKGLYDKEKFKSLGRKFGKSLIVYENGDINEYLIEGGSLFKYNEKRRELTVSKTFVKYAGSEKDGTNFNPKFENGSAISDKIREEARVAFENHKKELLEKKVLPKNSDTDLPF